MRPQEYNPLLERTRTSSVVLRNAFFTTYRQNFSPRLANTPELNGEASWIIQSDAIVFSQEYTARVSEESSREPVMLLKAKYEIVLFTQGQYPEEFAKEYSARQLHMLVRPYFRELLSNMAPRALLSIAPIPSQFVAPTEIIDYPAPQPIGEVVIPELPKTAKPSKSRKLTQE